MFSVFFFFFSHTHNIFFDKFQILKNLLEDTSTNLTIILGIIRNSFLRLF